MSKNTIILISVIIIVILGFYVYLTSLDGQFIWDDNYLVRDNIYIRSWSYIPKIFTKSIGGDAEVIYHSFRPIQILSYLIDYSLWGLNTLGYHLVSVLLHILVALCIYWFINLLFDDWLVSLMTSLLFVVHPIHTGAVSYISGRADPLATLFILLCFIFYIRFLNSKKISLFIISLAGFALSLLSRESSLILPILFLIYHYIFKKEIKLKYYLPVLSVAFIYILLRLTVLSYLSPHLLKNAPLFQRLPGFFVALTNYLKLLFLPFNLHMEYGIRFFKATNIYSLLGLMMVVLSLIYAFYKRTTNRLISFSIFWFMIGLIPFSNIYPLNAYMAEHWLYLPSIGFFLILSWILSSLYRRRHLKILVGIFTIGLLSFYSYLTIKQNDYWQEPISFYERTLNYAPGSFIIYDNLAVEYTKLGRYKEAINLYKKATEINPDYHNAYNNLGNAYSAFDSYQEAIASYKKAIEINPSYVSAHSNLGNAYIALGRYQEAINSYKKAIEINPSYAQAYFNIGIMHDDKANYQEAINSYKKAIEINPFYADAYYNLGIIYENKANYQEAINLYKKTIELNPDYASAYNNLAVLYYKKGEHDLAVKYCDRAIKLGLEVHPKFLELLKPYR